MIVQTLSGYEMPVYVLENMQPGIIIPINIPGNLHYCFNNRFNRPFAYFYMFCL